MDLFLQTLIQQKRRRRWE